MSFHVLSAGQGEMFDNIAEQEVPCIIFIKMDGCGPCNQLNGTWDELEGLMKQHPLQKHKFHLIKVNSKAKMKSPCTQGIRGYPTIRSVHKGKTHSEFKGERTTEELQKFIITSLKAIEKLNKLNTELTGMNSNDMRLTRGGRKKSKRRHKSSRHKSSRHKSSRHKRSRHKRSRHKRSRHKRSRY